MKIKLLRHYNIFQIIAFGKQIEFCYERLPRESLGFYKTVKHYQRHIITLKFFLGIVSKRYNPCGRGSAISLTILTA